MSDINWNKLLRYNSEFVFNDTILDEPYKHITSEVCNSRGCKLYEVKYLSKCDKTSRLIKSCDHWCFDCRSMSSSRNISTISELSNVAKVISGVENDSFVRWMKYSSRSNEEIRKFYYVGELEYTGGVRERFFGRKFEFEMFDRDLMISPSLIIVIPTFHSTPSGKISVDIYTDSRYLFLNDEFKEDIKSSLEFLTN